MYFTEKLNKEQLDFINSDNDLKEALNSISVLSDGFKSKDETALELDNFVKQIVDKNLKKPQPKKTNKPKNKSEQLTLEVVPENETKGEKIDIDLIKETVLKIIKERKICTDDLCEDLTKLLKENRIVKVHIPKLITGNFNADTPNILRIIDDYALGNNIFLVGGAGTGKTFLAEKVASVLGLGVEVINCNQFTSPIEINGGQTIEGYQEGKLIKAWSEGKMLILDELPKLDPNTAGILNEALAKTSLPENSERAYITNTRGERFKKKNGFGVIATGNIYPNSESVAYGANNKQDLSLLDRFVGSVYRIEKNPEFEKKVILPNHLFIWGLCDKLRTTIEVNKWEAQVSIRLMETFLRVYNAEMIGVAEKEDLSDRKTLKDAVDSYINTFTEPQIKEIKIQIMYDQYFSDFQYRKLDINKNPF